MFFGELSCCHSWSDYDPASCSPVQCSVLWGASNTRMWNRQGWTGHASRTWAAKGLAHVPEWPCPPALPPATFAFCSQIPSLPAVQTTVNQDNAKLC